LIQEKDLNLFQLNNSYREEISFSHCLEEYDSHQCLVTPKHNSSSKYFLQFPAIKQGNIANNVNLETTSTKENVYEENR